MRISPKPVRRCRTCLLNLGRTCWQFADPRRQWEGGRCRGFGDPALYEAYRQWLEQPRIKSRVQLRRESSSRRPAAAAARRPLPPSRIGRAR